MRAVREADHRAGQNAAALQHGRNQRHILRAGADGGGVVFEGQFAALADVFLREEGLQGAVVQELGNGIGGENHNEFLLGMKFL